MDPSSTSYSPLACWMTSMNTGTYTNHETRQTECYQDWLDARGLLLELTYTHTDADTYISSPNTSDVRFMLSAISCQKGKGNGNVRYWRKHWILTSVWFCGFSLKSSWPPAFDRNTNIKCSSVTPSFTLLRDPDNRYETKPAEINE